MFKTYSKEMVLKNINEEIMYQCRVGERRLKLKSEINAKIWQVVANARVQEYDQISINTSGSLNKGYIIEKIMLDWFNLEKETPDCEIKFFGNDTPNKMVNLDTNTVYIVVLKKTVQGVFKIDNMEKVRGKRLTLSYLQDENLLTTHCYDIEKYLGI